MLDHVGTLGSVSFPCTTPAPYPQVRAAERHLSEHHTVDLAARRRDVPPTPTTPTNSVPTGQRARAGPVVSQKDDAAVVNRACRV